MAKSQGFDFVAAERAFEALIAYCPDYSEGYNQRAFCMLLQQDHDASVTDLDRALEHAP